MANTRTQKYDMCWGKMKINWCNLGLKPTFHKRYGLKSRKSGIIGKSKLNQNQYYEGKKKEKKKKCMGFLFIYGKHHNLGFGKMCGVFGYNFINLFHCSPLWTAKYSIPSLPHTYYYLIPFFFFINLFFCINFFWSFVQVVGYRN